MCIGRIAEALDRGGFSDQTLLIVTSDNGAHVRGAGFDFQCDYGHRANYIYRGQKSAAWDGGHRIPISAVWPGHLPAGDICDQLVCQTDLPATAADAVVRSRGGSRRTVNLCAREPRRVEERTAAPARRNPARRPLSTALARNIHEGA